MRGRLTMVTGCMFSSKTRFIAEHTLDHRHSTAILPAVDTRSNGALRDHNGMAWMDASIVAWDEIDSLRPAWCVWAAAHAGECAMAVDEVQFFPAGFGAILREIADAGARVFAAGLLRDFEGQPFATTLEVLGRADRIVVATDARCSCGRTATETWRRIVTLDRVVIGGSESYEPCCRECWRRKREG